MVRQVKLIIFDLDGTLIDSTRDIANAVNYTLRKVGLAEKAKDEITSYIGWGVDDLVKKSLGKGHKDLFEKAITLFIDYYRKHATDSSHLYPNVKETLEYFKDKAKAVVTNRNYEFALSALKDLEIEHYFKHVVGGDNAGCMKPSSCPLDNILSIFKTNKKNTIMVGDMDLDVLSGKKAGVITCAVTYGIGKKDDIIKARPDFIIDDIGELRNIIG